MEPMVDQAVEAAQMEDLAEVVILLQFLHLKVIMVVLEALLAV
jgi:hypothetical protein